MWAYQWVMPTTYIIANIWLSHIYTYNTIIYSFIEFINVMWYTCLSLGNKNFVHELQNTGVTKVKCIKYIKKLIHTCRNLLCTCEWIHSPRPHIQVVYIVSAWIHSLTLTVIIMNISVYMYSEWIHREVCVIKWYIHANQQYLQTNILPVMHRTILYSQLMMICAHRRLQL